MARCIYSFVMGGLGNQMYQYAAGRATSLRTGLPLLLDLSWFSRGWKNSRPYCLGVFPLKASVATAWQLDAVARDDLARSLGLVPFQDIAEVAEEPHLHFWEGLTKTNGPMYLAGYWQSPLYFETYRDRLLEDFAFPPLPSGSLPLAARIAEQPNAVAVHVRRGDYISDPEAARFHAGCCLPQYYADAIDLLEQKFGRLSLFVFSDDAEWVRSNFDARGHDIEVVDLPEHREAPHHDMHLMTLARRHILANSSFSWWGAWLSASQTVIVPRRWFAEAGPETDYGNLTRHPSSWIVV